METDCGPIELRRTDGSLATLAIEGQPDRAVALNRRETSELIAEELRRLDPDDTYAATLRFGVDRLEPVKDGADGSGAGSGSGSGSGSAAKKASPASPSAAKKATSK
jgi:hypothetical protein